MAALQSRAVRFTGLQVASILSSHLFLGENVYLDRPATHLSFVIVSRIKKKAAEVNNISISQEARKDSPSFHDALGLSAISGHDIYLF